MKVALITDNHFGTRNDSKVFHEIFRDFYLNVFFPKIVEEGIKTILCGGDFFDRRKFINFETLNLAKEIFFDEAKRLGLDVHMIVGNHDVVYKNTNKLNSLQLLVDDGKYDNVTIYTDPEEVMIEGYKFLFCPWINQENYHKTMEMIKHSDARTMLSHLELSGFEYQTGLVSDHGQLDTEFLSCFDFVLTGHYHKKSTRGNIHYMGNPYQLTWADCEDTRGFHIFDGEALRFVVNPKANFVKMVYNDSAIDVKFIEKMIADKSVYRNLGGRYVKVILAAKKHPIQAEMFISNIEEAIPADLVIVDQTLSLNEAGMGDEIEPESTLDTLMHYIDNVLTTDLDKDLLKRQVSDLLIQAQSITNDE